MRKTILLADDDAAICARLGRILEMEYGVVVARTGREAASQLLVPHPPDLVLLDLNMPDKDGWEAWHLIRTLDTTERAGLQNDFPRCQRSVEC